MSTSRKVPGGLRCPGQHQRSFLVELREKRTHAAADVALRIADVLGVTVRHLELRRLEGAEEEVSSDSAGSRRVAELKGSGVSFVFRVAE